MAGGGHRVGKTVPSARAAVGCLGGDNLDPNCGKFSRAPQWMENRPGEKKKSPEI